MITLESRIKFAKRLGINRSVLAKSRAPEWLVIEGKHVNVEASLANRAAMASPAPHHQAQAARLADERGVGSAPTDESRASAHTEAGHRLRLATAKEREAKAELAAMERDKMAGLLVERSEVEFVLRDFGHSLRGLLENLPDRLAPVLAAHRGDVAALHASLQDAARDVQQEIAALMQRQILGAP